MKKPFNNKGEKKKQSNKHKPKVSKQFVKDDLYIQKQLIKYMGWE